jgi:hypothetical protein
VSDIARACVCVCMVLGSGPSPMVRIATDVRADALSQHPAPKSKACRVLKGCVVLYSGHCVSKRLCALKWHAVSGCTLKDSFTNKTVAWERVCRPQCCCCRSAHPSKPRFADGMGTYPISLRTDVVTTHSATRGARAHGHRVRVTLRQAVGRAGHARPCRGCTARCRTWQRC